MVIVNGDGEWPYKYFKTVRAIYRTHERRILLYLAYPKIMKNIAVEGRRSLYSLGRGRVKREETCHTHLDISTSTTHLEERSRYTHIGRYDK